MATSEPTGRAKAGFGLACAACCGIPVLVVAGVLSVAAAVAIGVTAGSLMLIAWGMWALWRGRMPAVGVRGRVAVALVGTAASAVGLVVGGGQPEVGRSLTTAGIAVLAVAALMALSSWRAHGDGTPHAA